MKMIIFFKKQNYFIQLNKNIRNVFFEIRVSSDKNDINHLKLENQKLYLTLKKCPSISFNKKEKEIIDAYMSWVDCFDLLINFVKNKSKYFKLYEKIKNKKNDSIYFPNFSFNLLKEAILFRDFSENMIVKSFEYEKKLENNMKKLELSSFNIKIKGALYSIILLELAYVYFLRGVNSHSKTILKKIEESPVGYFVSRESFNYYKMFVSSLYNDDFVVFAKEIIPLYNLDYMFPKFKM